MIACLALVAARRIQEMHGRFRIPPLLKRVDYLSRRGERLLID